MLREIQYLTGRKVWHHALRIAALGALAALAGCYAYPPGPPPGPGGYYAQPAPPPPGGPAGPGGYYQQPGPPPPPPPP
ncbi:hypothetical protein HF290_16635 [Acidithiobacillus ferrooxidans]|jgi:dishevelled associated activator of morphogenesis|uniref:hypothetical protein n=2 Tax=Acidithiobacillus ferrooxidans TaxID=920 RepID=UPI001C071E42|nr:hypothetical protein [Acidithiobacillus ferrooxidans]MBU2861942.1 hypothetical protein [Acidithiobacillus ferrooxidans]